MDLSVTRELDDEAVVMAVINHPDIIATIAEDGAGVPDSIDLDGHCFLILRVSGEVAGVYILQRNGQIEVDIHANILPEFRKTYGRPLTAMVLRWILDNTGFRS